MEKAELEQFLWRKGKLNPTHNSPVKAPQMKTVLELFLLDGLGTATPVHVPCSSLKTGTGEV